MINTNHIIPEDHIESLIKLDLEILSQERHGITILRDDLTHIPNAFDYTKEDLEQFLIKYNLT